MNSTPEPDDSLTPDEKQASEVEKSTEFDAEPSPDDAPREPAIADPVLLDAHDLALAALHEVTPPATVGDPADYRLEADGVVSLRFENLLAGYPGWFWTVSLARLGDDEPTVLEIELLPGEGALLAPDWVPWAERLADYQAAQAALAELATVDDDLDDVDDLDASDFDEDGSSILHAGDVDGVDIDELDTDADDSDDDESDDLGGLDDVDDESDDYVESDDADDELDESDDEDGEDDRADEDNDEYDPSEGDDSDG